MTDHDDELDRWIHRVVAAAGSDAPEHDELARHATPAPARRWPAAVAAAALVVLAIGAVVRTSGGNSSSSARPAATEASDPPTTSSLLDPMGSPTTSNAPAATDAAPTTDVTVELARPIIDIGWCRPTWARTRDLVYEGAYLWSRQNGMPIQVFVPAGGSLHGQFAVAVRVTIGLRISADNANTEVNGLPARVSFAKPTWGELLWRLADGSEAYLRTSTMTSDELMALAGTLEPRALDDSLPGFDAGSGAYELIAEDITPITITGIVDSECQPDDGGWMRATVIDEPLAQALFLTDRPAIPLAVRGLDDGRLLVVTGRDDIADRSPAVLDSVRDATDDEWAALTAADPDSFETGRLPEASASTCAGFVTRSIGDGLTVSLPDSAQFVTRASTADVGPIHASVAIALTIDGASVTVGRRIGDDLVPASNLIERRDDGVVVFVQADDPVLRTCLLDSASYDQAQDELE